VAGMNSCFNLTYIDLDRINQTIYNLSRDGMIDNYTNLETSRAVVYVGTSDKVVPSIVG